MHSRHWSARNLYAKHWKEIEWYTSDQVALPKDPAAFFARLFEQLPGWGLSMYEQDWMTRQYNGTDALKTNISLGQLWLHGMASGAAATNRTVLYCMSLP